ncbi:MAG: prefoldin subunit alpha [Thermoplasmata archaeon]|nr:MAG: prefoldin subunit alpha [Thermoplasmata archaeon]
MEKEGIQRDIALLQGYQERMDAVYQQVEVIEELVAEYRRARATLEEIGKAEKGRNFLVPIGGNIFLHASLEDNSTVLTGIGRNVLVEKSVTKALEFIDKRIEDFLKEEERLIKISQEIKEKVDELAKKLQAKEQD